MRIINLYGGTVKTFALCNEALELFLERISP